MKFRSVLSALVLALGVLFAPGVGLAASHDAYAVTKDQFNHVTFDPVTTTAVRIEVEPVTRHYRTGEIGPPAAMFLARDIDWREFGLIEWRVK